MATARSRSWRRANRSGLPSPNAARLRSFGHTGRKTRPRGHPRRGPLVAAAGGARCSPPAGGAARKSVAACRPFRATIAVTPALGEHRGRRPDGRRRPRGPRPRARLDAARDRSARRPDGRRARHPLATCRTRRERLARGPRNRPRSRGPAGSMGSLDPGSRSFGPSLAGGPTSGDRMPGWTTRTGCGLGRGGAEPAVFSRVRPGTATRAGPAGRTAGAGSLRPGRSAARASGAARAARRCGSRGLEGPAPTVQCARPVRAGAGPGPMVSSSRIARTRRDGRRPGSGTARKGGISPRRPAARSARGGPVPRPPTAEAAPPAKAVSGRAVNGLSLRRLETARRVGTAIRAMDRSPTAGFRGGSPGTLVDRDLPRELRASTRDPPPRSAARPRGGPFRSDTAARPRIEATGAGLEVEGLRKCSARGPRPRRGGRFGDGSRAPRECTSRSLPSTARCSASHPVLRSGRPGPAGCSSEKGGPASGGSLACPVRQRNAGRACRPETIAVTARAACRGEARASAASARLRVPLSGFGHPLRRPAGSGTGSVSRRPGSPSRPSPPSAGPCRSSTPARTPVARRAAEALLVVRSCGRRRGPALRILFES